MIHTNWAFWRFLTFLYSYHIFKSGVYKRVPQQVHLIQYYTYIIYVSRSQTCNWNCFLRNDRVVGRLTYATQRINIIIGTLSYNCTCNIYNIIYWRFYLYILYINIKNKSDRFKKNTDFKNDNNYTAIAVVYTAGTVWSALKWKILKYWRKNQINFLDYLIYIPMHIRNVKYESNTE